MTSYSHYTLEGIEQNFGIYNKRQPLFLDIIPQKVSKQLLNALGLAEELPVRSEKAKSEMIVVPILVELRNLTNKFFTIYSGEYLNVDETKGLKGECDFIIAKDTGSFNINVPILQVLEAKKHDIEVGIPQCAAQMIGAHLYNQQKGLDLEKIYGCVTNGDTWQFLKLEQNLISIDIKKYYLGNLEELMGVLKSIIDYYQNQLSV